MICKRPRRGLETHIQIACSTPVSDLTSDRLRRAVPGPTGRTALEVGVPVPGRHAGEQLSDVIVTPVWNRS